MSNLNHEISELNILIPETIFNSNIQSKYNDLQNAKNTYKGYELYSKVLHYGMGGNWWEIIVVKDGIGLIKFSDEAHTIADQQAKEWIDQIKLP